MTDQTGIEEVLVPEKSGLLQHLEQRWSLPGGVVNRPGFEPSSTRFRSAFLQRTALIDRLQSRAEGREDAGPSLELTIGQPTTAGKNNGPSVLSKTAEIKQTLPRNTETTWKTDSTTLYRVRRTPAVVVSSQTPTTSLSSKIGELNTLQRTTETNQKYPPRKKPQALINQTEPPASVAQSSPEPSAIPGNRAVGSLQLQRVPTKAGSTPYRSESEYPYKAAMRTAEGTGVGIYQRQQVPMVLRQGHPSDNSSESAARHAEKTGFEHPPPSSLGQRVAQKRLPEIISRSAISQPSSTAKGVVMPSLPSYQTGVDASTVNIGQLAEQVSRILSRRLAVERERRGIRR